MTSAHAHVIISSVDTSRKDTSRLNISRVNMVKLLFEEVRDVRRIGD